MDDNLYIFGIRHHGPGSARSLKQAIESYKPDVILVEGPPEADEAIHLVASDEMEPPVALLVYNPNQPKQAVFYPFAIFSPEWIAIRHGLANDIPVRFMDLPQSNRLGAENTDDGEDNQPPAQDENTPADPESDPIRIDPLGQLAEIAGFPDSERWWDHMVESRSGDHSQVFEAIADAMTALREQGLTVQDADLEAKREAHMRKTIRQAIKDGFERIAVVCGAWHVPALVRHNEKGMVGKDNTTLKGLPKVKTAVAWTPWSYDRLAFRSGYGAGVESPAYYHCLWSHQSNPAVHWMTQVARLMRDQDIDASSAHVIESVRLAHTLAALRDRPLPGLAELDEAALTVMCFGSDAPMQLIRRKLVIGDRLGQVPSDAPIVPLQQDLKSLQKRLRLPPSADEKDYDFDLRKPIDLERSLLLHRLRLLNVFWGELCDQHGKKGTFHEFWRLQWHPEFIVELIEAGRWGNTIETAATEYTINRVKEANTISALTELLDDALLAELPDAVSALLTSIQERAAVGGDTLQLMSALPALARVSRYGNVRQTDAAMVMDVSNALVARICIGLPAACSSLDDDAAKTIFDHITAVNSVVSLMQVDDHRNSWHTALIQLADQNDLHGLVAGRAVRILHDSGTWDAQIVAEHFSLALSVAGDPTKIAARVEGFLSGSGLLLIHDRSLWGLMDTWVRGLNADHFKLVLPLLRRTFATFPAPERRQMGELVKQGGTSARPQADSTDFNHDRAALVLPVLATILGIKEGEQ